MHFPFFSKKSLLIQYRKNRSVGIALNTKMTNKFVTKTSYEEAADFLGLYNGNTFVFDDENEVNVLQDFILYEYQEIDGRNVISHAIDQFGHSCNRTERDVLNAMNNAFTTLVEIESTNPEEGSVWLKDLITPDRKIHLMDIGCSASATLGAILFTRLLPFSRFHTTSGVMFVLPERVKDAAIRRYRRVSDQNEKCQSPYLWREFLNFNRKRGIEVSLQ